MLSSAHFLIITGGVIIATKNFVQPQQRPQKNNNDLVNEMIRFPEVLVIDQNGQRLGVKSRYEALRIAEAAELDLLCVAPDAKPAVCKILNYSKYRYEQQKRLKDIKKNQKIVEVKEANFTPLTNLRDLEIKAKAAKEWLSKGNKVKAGVFFKGRQLAHPEIGEETLRKFIELLSEVADIEKDVNMEGRKMFCILTPKKEKK